jgi:glycerophosphoryl diester phosphodiesterase
MRVLGHRGSAGRPGRPENTLAAVRAALDGGAAGVEVDVRRTVDGVLVCSHDADLGRVAGRGPGGGPAVGASTWADLRAVPLPGGTRVPRLEEVLDLAAARGATVVTEVKPVPGAARLTAARALRDLLGDRSRLRPGVDRVTTSSFDPLAAAALAGAAAEAGLLVEPWTDPDRAARLARDRGLDELHLPVQVLRRDPDAVPRARATGLRVVLWTVNAVGDLRGARDLGVSAVITDHPWLASAALAPSPGGRTAGEVRRRPGALAAPR